MPREKPSTASKISFILYTHKSNDSNLGYGTAELFLCELVSVYFPHTYNPFVGTLDSYR